METQERMLSNLYHSYVKGERTIEDIASELNLLVHQVEPVFMKVSEILASLTKLQQEKRVKEKQSVLNEYLSHIKKWKILKLEYNTEIDMFYAKYKGANNLIYDENFAVLTMEEAIQLQMEHEKTSAFSETRWYSKKFLADILEVPVEKIINKFPKVLEVDEIYGNEIEPIAEWHLGKYEFIKRVATKMVYYNHEICGGSLSYIGFYKGHRIFKENL